MTEQTPWPSAAQHLDEQPTAGPKKQRRLPKVSPRAVRIVAFTAAVPVVAAVGWFGTTAALDLAMPGDQTRVVCDLTADARGGHAGCVEVTP